jgi:uncharacterized protein YggE
MSTSDKRMILLTGIIAAGIFAAVFSGTQLMSASAQTTDEDNRSTISTSGSSTTRVDPDKVTVTVGVETNGTTAQEAASSNANLTAQIVAALTALGISEDDISTSSYNVYPVYDYKQAAEACIMIYPPPPECQPNQEISGYRASSSLSVTLDASGTIEAGEVIDTAIEAGANSIQGAYFFVSQERQEQVRDSMIPEALENARHRADVAANAAGMNVSGIKSISLNDVYFPVFSRGIEAQAFDTQILPGQQEVTMTVNVVYYLS